MTTSIAMMKKKGVENRTRRKLEEGSYDNFSVDIKKLFGKKKTILRLAWKGKYTKLRKHLQDKNTHKYINERDYCGRTALHYAASWDCPQITNLLLSIPNLNVDAQDGDQKTPLRKACEIKSLACIKLLAECGASLRIVGAYKRTPFEYLLQEHGDAAINIGKYLYEDPEVYTHRTEVGVVSYLHQVPMSNTKAIQLAEEMIKSGAPINATEGNGRTPLIVATQNKRPELVELFLKHGADAMHIDMDYKNALQYATPGDACYESLKTAMALQQHKNRAGVGTIDGRLTASQKLLSKYRKNIKRY